MTGGEPECLCVCVCEREKRERVDLGMRERGSVCVSERERGRVLPVQSDQCFGLPLAMWITAPTAYRIAIPFT